MPPELASLLGRPVLEVAPLLLGATLQHGEVAVRVTEVEAYDGANDPGSHAHRGPTPRNSVMFGPPGHLYVYFTYGMHHCCNVVVGAEGSPAAVLLRAGAVTAGLETARERRPRSADRDLARGPARLCRALAIDLAHNGARLDTPPLTLGLAPAPATVSSGPRVGLRLAPERAWRFWLPDEPTVSQYRPAVARPRPRPGGPDSI